jgi:hypothetical protein
MFIRYNFLTDFYAFMVKMSKITFGELQPREKERWVWWHTHSKETLENTSKHKMLISLFKCVLYFLSSWLKTNSIRNYVEKNVLISLKFFLSKHTAFTMYQDL